MPATYQKSTRKLGDGYTYFKTFTGADDGSTEPSLADLYSDANTFGGTDPTGSEFSVEREMFEDMISQELSAISKSVIGEEGQYKITVSAGNINNLALVMGLATSDVSTVSAGSMPGSFAAQSIMIGGQSSLQEIGLALKVCNSVSPLLSDWLYMPNCQAEASAGFKFVRDEIRKIESTFAVFPSKQSAFLGSGTCESMHGLAKLYYEYL